MRGRLQQNRYRKDDDRQEKHRQKCGKIEIHTLLRIGHQGGANQPGDNDPVDKSDLVSGIRDGGEGVSKFCKRDEEKYRCREEKRPDEKSEAFEMFPDDIGDRNDCHPKDGGYDAGESDDIHQLETGHQKQGGREGEGKYCYKEDAGDEGAEVKPAVECST